MVLQPGPLDPRHPRLGAASRRLGSAGASPDDDNDDDNSKNEKDDTIPIWRQRWWKQEAPRCGGPLPPAAADRGASRGWRVEASLEDGVYMAVPHDVHGVRRLRVPRRAHTFCVHAAHTRK